MQYYKKNIDIFSVIFEDNLLRMNIQYERMRWFITTNYAWNMELDTPLRRGKLSSKLYLSPVLAY